MRFGKLTSLKCSAAALLLAFLLGGCGRASTDKHETQIFAMDTVMILTAYGEHAEAGLDAASAVLFDLDRRLDPEEAGSEVYAVNHADGEPVKVTEPVYRMLETAAAIWSDSGGALDPTIYPLVKAWGFIDGNYRVPSEEELQALLSHVDMGAVRLEGDTVRLPAGMELSFGALAKGYAAQAAAEAMRDAGVSAAVLSLGGNVQTLGTKPDGKPWSVAVQDPFDTGDYAGLLQLGGGTAAVTSGGYQRFFEQDGVTYHHILDPATGMPSHSGLVSATVVCDDGTKADALSTAAFILGEQKSLELREKLGGFELVLITEDRRVIVTGGLNFTVHGDYTCETVE
jgi:thiamine biosynthesis lipoprotein